MTELGSQHFRTLNEIMYLDKIIKAAKVFYEMLMGNFMVEGSGWHNLNPSILTCDTTRKCTASPGNVAKLNLNLIKLLDLPICRIVSI